MSDEPVTLPISIPSKSDIMETLVVVGKSRRENQKKYKLDKKLGISYKCPLTGMRKAKYITNVSEYPGDTLEQKTESARNVLSAWKATKLGLLNHEAPLLDIGNDQGRGVPEGITEGLPEGITDDIQINPGRVSDFVGKLWEYSPFKLDIPSHDKTGASTILFGSSKSGKTTLLKYILNTSYNLNQYISFLCSPSIHSRSYKKVNAKVLRVPFYSDKLLKALTKIQRETKNKYAFLMSTDDVIDIKNNKSLLKLILTMRNSNISSLVCLQSITLLSKNARHNINNAIFLRQNNNEAIVEAMDRFLGSYKPFSGLRMDDKVTMYRDITKDYGFIYLNSLNDRLTFHRGVTPMGTPVKP